MYLDDIAAEIRKHIPSDKLPEGDFHHLLRLYAVLLRAKGQSVTLSDVHDAWSAWIAERDVNHNALLPHDQLDLAVQDEDRVFAAAIRAAASSTGHEEQSKPAFSEVLFPTGLPRGEEPTKQAFELYRIMVQSSEGLVSRRQGVNTFFLTMNGALLTTSGLILQSHGALRYVALGLSVLSVAGLILCFAWRSLITSFGQLNRGKFRVINAMERHFAASIYAAEWEALGRGEDPKVYRSFTSREIWVPTALIILHGVAAVVALLVTSGYVHL